MVSQENKLVGSFVLLAFGLFLVLPAYTDLGFRAVFVVVMTVGVVVPQLLLQYTDYGSE